jgi:hypothetical protein
VTFKLLSRDTKGRFETRALQVQFVCKQLSRGFGAS